MNLIRTVVGVSVTVATLALAHESNAQASGQAAGKLKIASKSMCVMRFAPDSDLSDEGSDADDLALHPVVNGNPIESCSVEVSSLVNKTTLKPRADRPSAVFHFSGHGSLMNNVLGSIGMANDTWMHGRSVGALRAGDGERFLALLTSNLFSDTSAGQDTWTNESSMGLGSSEVFLVSRKTSYSELQKTSLQGVFSSEDQAGRSQPNVSIRVPKDTRLNKPVRVIIKLSLREWLDLVRCDPAILETRKRLVLLSQFISVRLVGSEKALTIKPITSVDQRMTDDGAEFLYEVTPLQPGELELNVVVSSRFKSPQGEERADQVIPAGTMSVPADVLKQATNFFAANWQAILTLPMLAAIGHLLLGAWPQLRRQKIGF